MLNVVTAFQCEALYPHGDRIICVAGGWGGAGNHLGKLYLAF